MKGRHQADDDLEALMYGVCADLQGLVRREPVPNDPGLLAGSSIAEVTLQLASTYAVLQVIPI